MNTIILQKNSDLLSKWFEIILASVWSAPVPIKIQIDKANHRWQVSNREYQILNQKDKR